MCNTFSKFLMTALTSKTLPPLIYEMILWKYLGSLFPWPCPKLLNYRMSLSSSWCDMSLRMGNQGLPSHMITGLRSGIYSPDYGTWLNRLSKYHVFFWLFLHKTRELFRYRSYIKSKQNDWPKVGKYYLAKNILIVFMYPWGVYLRDLKVKVCRLSYTQYVIS